MIVAGCAAAHAAATNYTLITEPAQGLTPIYNLIESAQHTIDMTMYELSDTTAEQDLAARAAAGVTVRVILDINLEKSNNQAAYTYLNANGVQCHWANTTYAATHQKTITIDSAYSNAQTAIMTLNLTPQYYSTSRDFAIIENDPNDISAIETTFQSDFNSASVTPPVGDDLVWSPTNSQTQMVGLINSAQHTLLVENEEMSDTAIVNALVSAAKRGVNVQIVMNAGTYTSEWAEITAAGGNVSTYPATETGLYIHAKAIVADYGYSTGSFFQGSENFSSASLTENRELGLIVDNLPIMASLAGTLTSDFNGGQPQTGSPGDFTLSPSASTLSAAAGSSGTITLTATPFNSFKTSVLLSTISLPSGVTAAFKPASIANASGTSTLTLTVGSSVAAGSYLIGIVGTAGSIANATAVNLTVTGGTGGFSLSANPSSLSVQAGKSGTSTISSGVSGGFSSAVSLAASGLPSGVTASFSPTTISGGSGSSTLTLTASSGASAGTSTLTITGAGGGLTETATISLTITSGTAPSFSLSASPASVSVKAGSSGTSTITSAAAGGFGSAVSLSASGLPSGVTASFSPASISGGAGTSTLTLTVGSTSAAGTSTVTVTGAGGGLIESASVSLTITSGTTATFALSAQPASVGVTQGGTGTSTITATPSGGFSSAITLSASGLPSGVTASFSPTSIAGGSGTSMLTFTAGSAAALGTAAVTVTGTGGGVNAQTSIDLTVSSTGSGGQLIIDGSFASATKSGLSALGWTGATNTSGHNLIVFDGSYGYDGDKNYGSLGGVDDTNDTLTQTIAIPAGTTSAPLTFWLSIYTQESNKNGDKYDFLYVEVHNSGGTLLATPLTLSNLNGAYDEHTAYFQPRTVDLSAYAGQTIELVFHATNDFEDPTTFYLDGISVIAN